MAKNRKGRSIPDRVDNPQIKPRQDKAQVKSPRSFTGSDFTDFPRLVIQMNAPRPRPQRPARAPDRESPHQADEQGGRPQTSFARPLRGMGVGRYEGLRESMSPQFDAYRAAVHSAYADNTLSDEERTGLRQQRRGLRQDVRQYKRQNPLSNPLQSGLSERLKTTQGIGEQAREGTQNTRQQARSTVRTGLPQNLDQIPALIQKFKAGEITEEQLYELLIGVNRRADG